MKRLKVIRRHVEEATVHCHAAIVSPGGTLIALDASGAAIQGWGTDAWSTFEIVDDGPTALETALADVITERDDVAERLNVLLLTLGTAVADGLVLPDSVTALIYGRPA